MRFGQTWFPTDDPGLVTDANQIRQSLYDPSMGPITDPGPDPGQPEIVVTGHRAPTWPLLIVLAIVGYAMFEGGKRV